jgi:hypothetical protein
MKAILQIITYLRDRGVLSDDQINALAGKGFAPWLATTVPAADSADAADAAAGTAVFDTDHEPAESDDWPEGHVPAGRMPRRRGGRRRGAVVLKGPVLDAKSLRQRLRGVFGSWPQALDGLVRVARMIEPCADWRQAAVAVRNADPRALSRAVAQGLRRRDPPLDRLWEALLEEGYRSVVADRGLHGPSVSGYRALLEAADTAHVGRHARLLHHDEVADVCNVRLAQRRLLAAVEPVFNAHPDLIAACLQRDYHPAAYWAMVLLYSARRGRPGRRPLPGPGEHRPPRGPPDAAGWGRAWAQAIALDRRRVAPFLPESERAAADRGQKVCGAFAAAVAGLSEDARFYVYESGWPGATFRPLGHSHAPRRWTAETIALRDAMRAAVEAGEGGQRNPLLGIGTAPQDLAWWEAFVDEWLRAYRPSFADPVPCAFPDDLHEIVRRYYGATASLVCPRGWDW